MMLPGRGGAIDGKPVSVPDLVGSEVVDIPGELLKRYQKDEFYTKVGPRVLVSLNCDPIRRGSLEAASKGFAAAAKAYELEEMGPSIFSTSASAYLHMVKDGADQAILLCGESGSGKTLSKRLLIRNLCDLGRAPDARKKSKEHSNILKVDTVLSAFAHASTPFNPDATCVLPYMEIQYDGDGKVVGMKLIDYLLDKSRVTGPADGGRSFHIFHDLFEDLTREEKEELGLTDPAHFTYMAGTMRTTGPSERVAALVELRDDLKALGIGRRLQASLFKLIVGILHLGNVTFETSGKEGESCIIKNPQKLEIVAQILEVPLAVLQDVLIFKMKKIGRDTVSTFLDVEEAMGQRDALARALYLALFSWLMEKINEKLCKPESEWVNFVSVLDLPGMAGIDVAGNGFQRLLINYANERLHYLAIETLIGDWRNRYLKERINVYTPRITITRTVLDLLTSPRTGVLSVIHSATAKGATDETIIAKIVAGNEESASFANLTARSPFAFGIRHYSGTVDYDCRGFSETDADVLQGDFVTLIRGSPEHPGTNSAFLRSLFSDRLVATTTSAHDSSVVVAASNKLARYPSMKRKKDVSAVDENVDVSSTVGHQFQTNYEELLNTIVDSNLWFVFHILPALHGQSRVDAALISKQCQYYNLSVLKSHQAMMYPVEINKETFEERFGKKVLDIPKKDALIGATTIFLKESTWLEYEKEIETKIIQAQVMDDYAASERDDETASHYESEFEYPRDPNSMKMNQFGDVEQGKGSRSSKEQPKKKTTALRKRWLCCVWASTFCYFPICLSLCGRMKDRDRQIAWREKVTLCLLIFLMNALVLFFIIGIGLLLCFPKPQLSIGQVTTFNKLNAEAKVYMYGKFYAVEKIIKTHVDKTVREGQTAQYYENAVLGRDVSRMFPKLKFTSTYCPGYTFPSTFQEFSEPIPRDWEDHTLINGATVDYIPRMEGNIKGDIVWDVGTLSQQIELSNRRFITAYDTIYEVTAFYGTNSAGSFFPFPASVKVIFDRDSNVGSSDSTGALNNFRRSNQAEWNRMMSCMEGMFKVGMVDHRQDLKCVIPNYILLAASILLVSVIGFKFLAALQCYSFKEPEDHDKFAICQIPCYTEGEMSLTASIKSLASMAYDDKHKLIFVICDGMIVGSGNDRPTPRIVLDILGVDPNYDPEPLAYHALGDGNAQLNYGKIYSGLYEIDGHTVPYIVVVKVGKPSERVKPGNRGKRDSQLILMRFLSRVHHNEPMCPLELELYHQMKNVVGVDPSLYEFALMVDADTQVASDALSRMVSHMLRDVRVAATCGETKISNENASFTSMIQVYEYFISHHMAKAFESLFSTVTCLPGCFSMYRIRATAKNIPILTSPQLVKDYSENQVDTLHLRNLLHLGEDRYLTTLLLKHFPNMKTTFTPDARCVTNAPDKWSILLSQRRRWINSTIHNLLELLYLQELCGFCCFSMRFIVFIDLLATLVQPASLIYIVYLIFLAVFAKEYQTNVPVVSLILIAAVYGFQIIIFLFRAEWQHIGWMIFYLLATPVFGFYIPLYSFWHFDDFSWGNTRVIVGEKGKKVLETKASIEPFDPKSVTLRTFYEYEATRGARDDNNWDAKSVQSFRSEHTFNPYGGPSAGPQAQIDPPPGYFPGVPNPRQSYIGPTISPGMAQSGGTAEILRRRSIQSNWSEGVKGPSVVPVALTASASAGSDGTTTLPTDEELLMEIRHILSTSDLMTITKKKVRQQLGKFFGVDLSSKKDYIHECIDSILKGEL